MQGVSQAEIGRRMYHVHRGKRVEQAIKLIQQGVGAEWRSLEKDDIIVLGHMLQCTWNTIDQRQWEAIPFGTMKMDRVRKILTYGEGVRPGHNPSPEAVAATKEILLSLA